MRTAHHREQGVVRSDDDQHGGIERAVAVEVNEAGRGQRLSEEPAQPDVRLAMDRETFIVLAGGRRSAEPGSVTIEGDAELGRAIVENLGTTP